MPRPSAAGVSRRVFVRTTLGTVLTAGAAASVSACTGASGELPPVWRTPALLEALGAERVRRIGAAWRAQHAAERTPEALRDALGVAWRRQPVVQSAAPDRAAAEALAQAISDDFETDRIVVVDGWLLAVTEARQCALYGLSTT